MNQQKRIKKSEEWLLRILYSSVPIIGILGIDCIISVLLCPIAIDIPTDFYCWYPNTTTFPIIYTIIKIIIAIPIIILINKLITKYGLYKDEEE